MLDSYKTFLKSETAEIVEKKSRFIGRASYAESEEEALAFINSVRKANNGANHNVYAYRLNGPSIYERQSDDGEPSGTAGLPILDVLRGENIINGVIAVTRYFGGTLLGTGGLVRAYGKAAKQCAFNSVIVEKKLYAAISIIVDYGVSGKVEYELLRLGHVINDTVYTDKVEFKVFTLNILSDKLVSDMTDLTLGKAVIKRTGSVYATVSEGKFVLMGINPF